MKIRDIKTYRLDAVLAEPFAYSQAWYERRGSLLVEIISEDGLSGWGEAFGPPLLTAPIVDFYKPLLIGADPLATELHWQNLYNRLRDHGQKGLAIEALSAVDIALWDLKGRHLGLPVHRLMGGPLRSRVQAYATGFYRKRGGDPLSYLIEEAQQRAEAGFSAIKLKLGFGIDEDIRLCQSIRRSVGDRMTIMVDANHAYDATAAMRVGRQIEELDIAWFEEPVPPEDLQGYRQVRSALRIPIAGGEQSLPAGVSDRSSSSGRSISCSRMSAPPAGSPSARKSQTWRMRSGYASIPMYGERVSPWRLRCS